MRRRVLRISVVALAAAALAWSIVAPTNWWYWLSLLPLIPAFAVFGAWLEDDFPSYPASTRRGLWAVATALALAGSVLYLVVQNNHVYVAGGWLAFPLFMLIVYARARVPSDPGQGFPDDGPWDLP